LLAVKLLGAVKVCAIAGVEQPEESETAVKRPANSTKNAATQLLG
jgi:hypothetical protein